MNWVRDPTIGLGVTAGVLVLAPLIMAVGQKIIAARINGHENTIDIASC